jgi:Flp pilus assembly protein TadG
MIRRSHTRRRDGAALVEFAVVAMVFFMVLFAIFEFAYLVMVNNMLDNAVREGARYAAVNTAQGSSLNAAIQDVVDAKMVGVKARLVGYNKTTSIVVTAINPVTGTQLTDSTGANVNTWDTAFGQFIQVQLTVTYKPILPSVVMLPSSFTMTANAVTNSESN